VYRRGDGARSDARPRGPEFVRFRVNWGFRGGANPRRLLATLCRRGGVTNREIGSIDIGPAFSTFEVTGYAADAFFERAGRDDPRDPGLFVSRDDAQREGPRDFGRPPRPRGPRRG
jgi:ATP-dependent RNA helicase DeaD